MLSGLMVTMGLTTQTFKFFTDTLVGVLVKELRHYCLDITKLCKEITFFPFFYDVIIHDRRMSQHTDDLTLPHLPMNATEKQTNVWHVVLMSMAESLVLKQLPFPQT